MADQTRSGKLKRLVNVQRHLEHMAENELATTTQARAEVAENMEAVVDAIGSVNSVHQLFASLYSAQISRLTAKDQHLQNVQKAQEQKILREKAKGDRLESKRKVALDLEDAEAQEKSLQEILEIRMALSASDHEPDPS